GPAPVACSAKRAPCGPTPPRSLRRARRTARLASPPRAFLAAERGSDSMCFVARRQGVGSPGTAASVGERLRARARNLERGVGCDRNVAVAADDPRLKTHLSEAGLQHLGGCTALEIDEQSGATAHDLSGWRKVKVADALRQLNDRYAGAQSVRKLSSRGVARGGDPARTHGRAPLLDLGRKARPAAHLRGRVLGAG